MNGFFYLVVDFYVFNLIVDEGKFEFFDFFEMEEMIERDLSPKRDCCYFEIWGLGDMWFVYIVFVPMLYLEGGEGS